jgi:hypothetical protein
MLLSSQAQLDHLGLCRRMQAPSSPDCQQRNRQLPQVVHHWMVTVVRQQRCQKAMGLLPEVEGEATRCQQIDALQHLVEQQARTMEWMLLPMVWEVGVVLMGQMVVVVVELFPVALQ